MASKLRVTTLAARASFSTGGGASPAAVSSGNYAWKIYNLVKKAAPEVPDGLMFTRWLCQSQRRISETLSVVPRVWIRSFCDDKTKGPRDGKENKESKERTANKKSRRILNNLMILLLCACSTGGLITLWSYWRLKKRLSDLLGIPSLLNSKKYLYPFDPAEVEFFVKKHCFMWLPGRMVTTPAAWKLFQECSQEGSGREIAIEKLSSMEDLLDSECLHFALSLDLKTAIALAHNGADPRIFPPPPVCSGLNKSFQAYFGGAFRIILDPLPRDNIHPHLNLMFRSALETFLPNEEEKYQQELDKYIGFEESPASLNFEISEERFLKICLQATISHTRDPLILKGLPKSEVLDLLVVITGKYHHNTEIMSLALKVLANLSCDPGYADDIRNSGLLRKLVEASKTDEIRRVLPAKRALHNLDRENSSNVLLSGIYQLYPDFRTDESVLEYDIVFIHGILGGVFRTWRQEDRIAAFGMEASEPQEGSNVGQNNEEKEAKENGKGVFIANRFLKTPVEHPDEAKIYKSRWEVAGGTFVSSDEDIEIDTDHVDSPETQCWPREWLPHDCPNARIIAVDFDSFVTHWSEFHPVETTKRRLADRANELLQKLHAAGVGQRPIIWITHSMGGLLAKHIICQAVENKEMERICKNTKGIVFCSVPHVGSYIALANTSRRYIFMPTEEALELTNSDNNLTILHERFMRLFRAYKFKILSFGEVLKTQGVFKVPFKMVPFSSSDPGVGDYFLVKLNHLNTCKPHCKGSFVYQKIVEMIHKLMDPPPTSDEK